MGRDPPHAPSHPRRLSRWLPPGRAKGVDGLPACDAAERALQRVAALGLAAAAAAASGSASRNNQVPVIYMFSQGHVYKNYRLRHTSLTGPPRAFNRAPGAARASTPPPAAAAVPPCHTSPAATEGRGCGQEEWSEEGKEFNSAGWLVTGGKLNHSKRQRRGLQLCARSASVDALLTRPPVWINSTLRPRHCSGAARISDTRPCTAFPV